MRTLLRKVGVSCKSGKHIATSDGAIDVWLRIPSSTTHIQTTRCRKMRWPSGSVALRLGDQNQMYIVADPPALPRRVQTEAALPAKKNESNTTGRSLKCRGMQRRLACICNCKLAMRARSHDVGAARADWTTTRRDAQHAARCCVSCMRDTNNSSPDAAGIFWSSVERTNAAHLAPQL